MKFLMNVSGDLNNFFRENRTSNLANYQWLNYYDLFFISNKHISNIACIEL
jgi:hypothetical protein